MADGTGVRLQEPKGLDPGKADMRWDLASVEENNPFEPVGLWAKKSWSKIRENLENRLVYDRLKLLFSDAEPGIEEALLEEGMRHQRCILHGERDPPYILYLDGLKKAQQLPLREKLVSIPAFQFREAKTGNAERKGSIELFARYRE